MRFTYTAQNKDGKEIRGEVEAADERAAAKAITRKGYLPLNLHAVGIEDGSGKFKKPLFIGSSLTIFDQIVITRHLGTILSTGTDLLTGLEIIARDAIKPTVKRIVLDIRSRVSTGETLSQALGAWKDQFNPVFLSLVRAAEMSGNLAPVLSSYAKELRKDYNFSRKVKGAMTYPAILLVALSIMLMIILWFVVPRLKELFGSTNVAPPIYTKILFSISDFWVAHWLFILIGIAVVGVGMIFALRDPRLRRKFKVILWHLPYLRNIQQNHSLLRFSKTLATLIRAGIPIESALKVTGNAIGGRYEPILTNIADHSLSRGIALSDAMRQHPKYFPGILVSVVATGEKSGSIDATLMEMAEFYEEEVLYALERFLVIIEPLLIVIVGIIIGLMAASLIAPIYRFVGAF